MVCIFASQRFWKKEKKRKSLVWTLIIFRACFQLVSLHLLRLFLCKNTFVAFFAAFLHEEHTKNLSTFCSTALKWSGERKPKGWDFKKMTGNTCSPRGPEGPGCPGEPGRPWDPGVPGPPRWPRSPLGPVGPRRPCEPCGPSVPGVPEKNSNTPDFVLFEFKQQQNLSFVYLKMFWKLQQWRDLEKNFHARDKWNGRTKLLLMQLPTLGCKKQQSRWLFF